MTNDEMVVREREAQLREVLAELSVTTNKAKREALREEADDLVHADCTMPCSPGCPAF